MLLLSVKIKVRKHGYMATSFYQVLKYVMQNIPAQARPLFWLISAISLGESGIIVKPTNS